MRLLYNVTYIQRDESLKSEPCKTNKPFKNHAQCNIYKLQKLTAKTCPHAKQLFSMVCYICEGSDIKTDMHGIRYLAVLLYALQNNAQKISWN